MNEESKYHFGLGIEMWQHILSIQDPELIYILLSDVINYKISGIKKNTLYEMSRKRNYDTNYRISLLGASFIFESVIDIIDGRIGND